MELIDKDALVAEIERRKEEEVSYDENGEFASWAAQNYYSILSSIQDFLDIIEAKNEDLINLHKACEWVRKKYGEEAVVNFCKAMEE